MFYVGMFKMYKGVFLDKFVSVSLAVKYML